MGEFDQVPGPEAHLDWISGMLTVHPELIPRVETAYRRLLAAPDPVVGRAVLDQADQHPSRHGFVRILVTAIAESAAALRRVEDSVLQEHVEHCVAQAIRSGDAAEQRRKVEELLDVLVRFSD